MVIRAPARAMEFGRAALLDYRRRLVERGGSGEALDARAWALAPRYFDLAPNGDYMLEVLAGTATHNYRAPARDAAAH